MNTVPDYGHVPQKLFDTGLYNLRTHDGHEAFVDAVVATLNGLDPNFQHLKKRPGQTQRHGHGEDSALYLFDDGTALGIDFIQGAGGDNPRPRWGVGDFVYKHSDAHDPDDHGIGRSAPAPAPSPSFVLPPDRAEAWDELNWLDAYYSAPDGLMRPNGLSLHNRPDFEGVSAWYIEVYQRERMKGRSRADARAAVVANIRGSDEWKAKHPGERP